MNIVTIKNNVSIKAIQLTRTNMNEVYNFIIDNFDLIDISAVHCRFPEPLRERMYGQRQPYVYEMARDTGITLSMVSGSTINIGLHCWAVLMGSGERGLHLDVFEDFEFKDLFECVDPNGENHSFKFSLINDSSLQQVFRNPNDYRLFCHILDVYIKQISSTGFKNIIPLKTSATMKLCHMSDKTFRKSKNSLIDLGVIYQSTGGYKISFEMLNKTISQINKSQT